MRQPQRSQKYVDELRRERDQWRKHYRITTYADDEGVSPQGWVWSIIGEGKVVRLNTAADVSLERNRIEAGDWFVAHSSGKHKGANDLVNFLRMIAAASDAAHALNTGTL